MGYTLDKGVSYKHSFYVCALLSSSFLFAIFATTLFPQAQKTEETLAAPTPSTTTLSMTTPSVGLSLAINDINGTFASETSNFTVTTNNYTGYTLSIRAKEDNANNSKLINGSHVLNSISAATADDTGFNIGDWGYKPSKLDSAVNTDYLPSPTYTGSTLDVTNAANSTANTYSIALAAKADYAIANGAYSNTFVLSAVGNPVNYAITYDKNTTDTVSNMPSTQSGELSANDVILSANTPSRTDAIFLGWCNGTTTQVVDITTDDSCNGTTHAAGATYPTSMQTGNTVTLKAMWRMLPATGSVNRAFYNANKTPVTVSGKQYYKMQDMTSAICNAIVAGNEGQLADTRDNYIYDIGKLLDTKCWIIKTPLLLDLITYKNVLSSSNTNALDTTLNYLRNGGGSTPYASAPLTNDTSADRSVPVASAIGKYNQCATSAGLWCVGANTAIRSYMQSNNIPWQDICPKSWRMPTQNEHAQLVSNYSDVNPIPSGIMWVFPGNGSAFSSPVCTITTSDGIKKSSCGLMLRGNNIQMTCLAK